MSKHVVHQDTQPSHVEARAKRGLPRALILGAIATLATVGFIAIALRVVEGHTDAFDRKWALAIHAAVDSSFADALMIAFTKLGDSPGLYGSIAVVSLLAWRRNLRPITVVLLVNALLSLGVNVALKYWFVRDRPRLFAEITRPETYSFPSGHAMSAIMVFGAVAAVLIALYPRRRWLIVATATIAIIGVGLSRIYLGVHWPADVLAGYASGVPFLVVTVHVVHRMTHRLREPVP